MPHRLRPFCDGPEHGDRIHVLVALLVEPRGIRLADDANQRRTIHVGVGNAGHQIGRARPQGAQADARLARQTAIGIRHERGRLLVAAQDEFDLAVDQRHHHIRVLFAGDPEDVGHTLFFEALHEQIGSLHLSLASHQAVTADFGKSPIGSFSTGLARIARRRLNPLKIQPRERANPHPAIEKIAGDGFSDAVDVDYNTWVQGRGMEKSDEMPERFGATRLSAIRRLHEAPDACTADRPSHEPRVAGVAKSLTCDGGRWAGLSLSRRAASPENGFSRSGWDGLKDLRRSKNKVPSVGVKPLGLEWLLYIIRANRVRDCG